MLPSILRAASCYHLSLQESHLMIKLMLTTFPLCSHMFHQTPQKRKQQKKVASHERMVKRKRVMHVDRACIPANLSIATEYQLISKQLYS